MIKVRKHGIVGSCCVRPECQFLACLSVDVTLTEMSSCHPLVLRPSLTQMLYRLVDIGALVSDYIVRQSASIGWLLHSCELTGAWLKCHLKSDAGPRFGAPT